MSHSPVKVDLYERIWLWVASALIVGFLTIVIVGSVAHAIHPASHVETIDPELVRTESEFARPGLEILDDGTVLVRMVASMYAYEPSTVEVPVDRKVRFRITSPDVIHGFQIVGTNANATIVPGYVSEFEVTFPRTGEYLVVCNEYCGLSHHLMQGRLTAREREP